MDAQLELRKVSTLLSDPRKKNSMARLNATCTYNVEMEGSAGRDGLQAPASLPLRSSINAEFALVEVALPMLKTLEISESVHITRFDSRFGKCPYYVQKALEAANFVVCRFGVTLAEHVTSVQIAEELRATVRAIVSSRCPVKSRG